MRREDVAVSLLSRRVANHMAREYHYLHRPRVGSVLAYEVHVCGKPEGFLMFARAPVSGPMFGFAPTEIVELARVWFRTNPKNLGSCAIRKSLRRIQRDWPGTKAVISWCDTSRFDGALYKATGFELMGLSRVRSAEPSGKIYGGGRKGRIVQSDRLSPKQQWLIRLPKDGK